MTARSVENDVPRPPETDRTGWVTSRDVREEGVRTCLAPVEDGCCPPSARRSPEWNIVRGED